ncbi:hypothetical protein RAE06_07545 [Corynebacterium tuberculostearicum]|uniref:hypothetical protein n=1 Tax=Corynebacterium tuberculostearicum TaxID=38304 RepID=UPI002934300F|nr:hypothetical protein [Corynebacterium tuberculostearicum]MDV2428746.1 hypothetical protein [Corynebacterium tuberculostearicum]MDV2431720.1 hypothetical protein [Corynebacterium tuberculostearicum]
MTSRRNRRRVFRQSAAADYDRSADKPGSPAAHGADEERIVTVDDGDSAAAEGESGQRDEQFYRENQPPHYGG